jgi:hypothetical protein
VNLKFQHDPIRALGVFEVVSHVRSETTIYLGRVRIRERSDESMEHQVDRLRELNGAARLETEAVQLESQVDHAAGAVQRDLR